MDLSGGNQDRAATYTAADGTVVTSSANTYANGIYYYLAYAFDNSGPQCDNDGTTTAATHYYLSSGGSPCTLTVQFPQARSVTAVRLIPRGRGDTCSDFAVSALPYGSGSAVDLSGGTNACSGYTYGMPWTTTTSALPLQTQQITLTLTKRGQWGCSVQEVKIYSC